MFNFVVRLILDHTGARLALRDGTLLPPRCAVCNRPVETPPRRRRIACTAVGSDLSRITLYLHLCRWHASRRLLVGILSGAVAVTCGIVSVGKEDGVKPTTQEFVAFVGLVVGGLFFINAVFFDPFFRGLTCEAGLMEIKGFGRRFRESLREGEIRTIDDDEFAAIRRPAT